MKTGFKVRSILSAVVLGVVAVSIQGCGREKARTFTSADQRETDGKVFQLCSPYPDCAKEVPEEENSIHAFSSRSSTESTTSCDLASGKGACTLYISWYSSHPDANLYVMPGGGHFGGAPQGDHLEAPWIDSTGVTFYLIQGDQGLNSNSVIYAQKTFYAKAAPAGGGSSGGSSSSGSASSGGSASAELAAFVPFESSPGISDSLPSPITTVSSVDLVRTIYTNVPLDGSTGFSLWAEGTNTMNGGAPQAVARQPLSNFFPATALKFEKVSSTVYKLSWKPCSMGVNGVCPAGTFQRQYSIYKNGIPATGPTAPASLTINSVACTYPSAPDIWVASNLADPCGPGTCTYCNKEENGCISARLLSCSTVTRQATCEAIYERKGTVQADGSCR